MREELILRNLAAFAPISLASKGNFATPFNTEGMYRGWIGADGVPHVAIYKE